MDVAPQPITEVPTVVDRSFGSLPGWYREVSNPESGYSLPPRVSGLRPHTSAILSLQESGRSVNLPIFGLLSGTTLRQAGFASSSSSSSQEYRSEVYETRISGIARDPSTKRLFFRPPPNSSTDLIDTKTDVSSEKNSNRPPASCFTRHFLLSRDALPQALGDERFLDSDLRETLCQLFWELEYEIVPSFLSGVALEPRAAPALSERLETCVRVLHVLLRGRCRFVEARGSLIQLMRKSVVDTRHLVHLAKEGLADAENALKDLAREVGDAQVKPRLASFNIY